MSASLCFRTIIQGIKVKHPSVKNVTTATLQSWIDGGTTTAPSVPSTSTDGKDKKLIIIDSRPEREFVVSHIATSINVNYEMEDMDYVKKLMLQEAGCDSPEQTPANVVLYCAVGYRSSILTDKLLKATRQDPTYKRWRFFNLEGSIFKWANEDRPLVDQQGQPTKYVHPYDGKWGRLIDAERWKYSP